MLYLVGTSFNGARTFYNVIDPTTDPATVIDAGDQPGQIPAVIGEALSALVDLRRGGLLAPFPEVPFPTVRADFPHTADR